MAQPYVIWEIKQGENRGEKVAGTQNNLLRLNQNIHKEANYPK